MKFVIMFGAILIAVLMGMLPKPEKRKSMIWKLFTIITLLIAIAITLIPPISGNLSTLVLLEKGYYDKLDLDLKLVEGSAKFIDETQNWEIKFTNEHNNITDKLIVKSTNLPDEFKNNSHFILNVSYDKKANAVIYHKIKSVNPSLWYPFVPNLEERIRILNLHVPMAWISVVAYMIGMIYSIRFLRTKNFDYDDKNVVAASLGTLFAVLATVTGMLWAKYNWGSYWNWDPRQTSILILILIYAAFFALRSAIENDESRARLSSVYSIIAFITVPFLIFILPRMAGGLHPGSAEDVNAGPVISQQQSALDSLMVYSFGLSLLSFTLMFFWMFNIQIRYKILRRKSLTNK